MTTPNLAPCPFCTGPMTIEPIEAIYGRPKFCPYCAECDHCGEHYPTPAAASAAWNARFTLPSRAWEMGRDAAAERIDPASDLADHELTEWGMTRREAANQARALTPPATLAGIEISDEMVERASIAAWDAWNDVNDHRALGWPAWQSLHPVQAMEWRESIRAALTAALTDGESNG